jgi:hypothetical protein
VISAINSERDADRSGAARIVRFAAGLVGGAEAKPSRLLR